MIDKNQAVGNHSDVTTLVFGAGDIMFSKLNYQNGFVGLAFSNMPPHKIGEESKEFTGGTLDDVPNVQVVMDFTDPRSITALIHSLIEIQQDMFNHVSIKETV